ncbi:MAG: flagellar basal body P-ring formation chaperone FlgA [Burkholderiaceae bacterium]
MTPARALPADRLARRLAVAGALAAAFAGPALAQDEAAFAPDAALIQQVETVARSGAAAASKGEGQAAAPAVRVEVKVGRLDPRLRLAPCQKIEPYLPPGLPAWGSTRMGLRCTQGPKRWNVSLPVTIGVFTRATVLKDALPAGTVLDASQLMQAEVDIAAAPGAPVFDPAAVLGRTLARSVAAGAALRMTDLKARQYFSAGETVRVTAVGSGWNVTTDAQAISAGVEGQMARVRTDGGRILVARPSGDHQVEVVL